MNVILAKAVAFQEALQPEFEEYAKQVVLNAKTLANHLTTMGFKLVTNGTDNHIILIDMISSFNMGGKEAEQVLDSIGLTTNKNVIPNDSRKPFDPSGIRLGTPALTTRGIKEDSMEILARWIYEAINNPTNEAKLNDLKQEVKAFLAKYPIPGTGTARV